MQSLGRLMAGAALAAGLSATAANATVVFDNMQQPFQGAIASAGPLGMQFVPFQSGRLTGIDLPLELYENLDQPHHAVVTLYAGLETTVLDSWDFTVSDPLGSFQSITTLIPNTLVALIAGNDYWVSVSSPEYFTDTGVAWAFTNFPSGPRYLSFDSADYSKDGVQFEMRVLAAVPEPATWALFILGFGAIGATLRARRERGMAAA